MNPQTCKKYLTEALEEYEGLNDAVEIEKLCKFFKINMGTWLYNTGEGPEDVSYEHMCDIETPTIYYSYQKKKVAENK